MNWFSNTLLKEAGNSFNLYQWSYIFKRQQAFKIYFKLIYLKLVNMKSISVQSHAIIIM
jgi:hypothetical protein